MAHITLAEAKAHLRVDHAEEDVLIEDVYLPAALEWVSDYTGRILVQDAEPRVDRLKASEIDGWLQLRLPVAPVDTVVTVTLIASDGAETELVLEDDYQVDTYSDGMSAIAFDDGLHIEHKWVEVEYTAGYADGFLPAALKAATLFMLAHFFENRMPLVIGTISQDLPLAVRSLCDPYRMRIFAGA